MLLQCDYFALRVHFSDSWFQVNPSAIVTRGVPGTNAPPPLNASSQHNFSVATSDHSNLVSNCGNVSQMLRWAFHEYNYNAYCFSSSFLNTTCNSIVNDPCAKQHLRWSCVCANSNSSTTSPKPFQTITHAINHINNYNQQTPKTNPKQPHNPKNNQTKTTIHKKPTTTTKQKNNQLAHKTNPKNSKKPSSKFKLKFVLTPEYALIMIQEFINWKQKTDSPQPAPISKIVLFFNEKGTL